MINNLTESLDNKVKLILEEILNFNEISGCIVRTAYKTTEENVWDKTIATQGIGDEFSEAINESIILAIKKNRVAQHFEFLARDDSAKVYPAVAVPIISGQNIIGLLTVIGWPLATNFNETMVKFFTTIGFTIGILIQSIKKNYEINQLNYILKRIFNLRDKLSLDTNKKIFYNMILGEIEDYFGAKWCVMRYLDKETGNLIMLAGNEEIEKIAKCISPKGTLLEKVLQTKQIQSIDDIKYCEFKILPYINDIRSIAVVPIIFNNEIRGTLKIYFPNPHRWLEEELEYLNMLGDLIGLIMSEFELHEKMKYITFNVVYALSNSLEAKDNSTFGHSNRVAKYAVKCGRAIGLSKEELVDLEQTALLHDIGKIGLPDKILLKSSRLDKIEWEAVQKHSETGYDILKVACFSNSILLGVLQHHEDFDGEGYPNRIAGEEISLFARVIRIVDAYDAMTQERSYKDVMTHEEALEEIKRCSGSHFDPDIVKIFIKNFEKGIS